jgi:hypothetical protein
LGIIILYDEKEQVYSKNRKAASSDNREAAQSDMREEAWSDKREEAQTEKTCFTNNPKKVLKSTQVFKRVVIFTLIHIKAHRSY